MMTFLPMGRVVTVEVSGRSRMKITGKVTASKPNGPVTVGGATFHSSRIVRWQPARAVA